MASWVRVDTRFPSHPKVLDVGPLGEALWLRGLCYAGEQMTDGFVPLTYLKRMGDMKAVAVAGRLVAAGLWREADGGYQIHDYLEWQRSRDDAAELSSKRAESGRKGGYQKASNLLANSQADAKQKASKRLADKNREDKSREELPPLVPPEGGKRARQIPENFSLTEKHIAYATAKGFASEQVPEIWEHFAAHHAAKGTRHVDWDKAWQTWVLGQKTRFAPRTNGQAPPGRYLNAAEKGTAAYREVIAAIEQRFPKDDPDTVDVPYRNGAQP